MTISVIGSFAKFRVFIVLFYAVSLRGEMLQIVDKKESYEIPEGLREQEVNLQIKNVSGGSLTILNARSSCGCLVPHVDPKTLQANEVSVVKLIYRRPLLGGIHSRRIVFETDNAQEKIAVLNLKFSSPPIVSFSPLSLTWTREEGSVEKSIKVTMGDSGEVLLLDVEASNEQFVARIKTTQPGKEYVVSVRPR